MHGAAARVPTYRLTWVAFFVFFCAISTSQPHWQSHYCSLPKRMSEDEDHVQNQHKEIMEFCLYQIEACDYAYFFYLIIIIYEWALRSALTVWNIWANKILKRRERERENVKRLRLRRSTDVHTNAATHFKYHVILGLFEVNSTHENSIPNIHQNKLRMFISHRVAYK